MTNHVPRPSRRVAQHQAIFVVVRDHISSHGFSPSYDEMADRTGLAKSACHRVVGELINAGRLINIGGFRGLRLAKPGADLAKAIRDVLAIFPASDVEAELRRQIGAST